MRRCSGTFCGHDVRKTDLLHYQLDERRRWKCSLGDCTAGIVLQEVFSQGDCMVNSDWDDLYNWLDDHTFRKYCERTVYVFCGNNSQWNFVEPSMSGQ